ncbi:hypothetical protein [Deinococcus sp.]|uniref:hypothetical protein n=1 Tax=Deinococcus sp. TaxID=47478 RepID=UPI0025F5C285|nr:hypothetical protein [Deinococcus sp.]
MLRFVLPLLTVTLLVLLGLAGLWLIGQLVSGLGEVLVATALLLGGVLRFVVLGSLLGSVAYVLGSAWSRPAARQARA